MPGPVRYDKKGRVKKKRPKSYGSASSSSTVRPYEQRYDRPSRSTFDGPTSRPSRPSAYDRQKSLSSSPRRSDPFGLGRAGGLRETPEIRDRRVELDSLRDTQDRRTDEINRETAKKWSDFRKSQIMSQSVEVRPALVPKKDENGLPILKPEVDVQAAIDEGKKLADRIRKIDRRISKPRTTADAQYKGELNKLRLNNRYVQKYFESQRREQPILKVPRQQLKTELDQVNNTQRKIAQGKYDPKIFEEAPSVIQVLGRLAQGAEFVFDTFDDVRQTVANELPLPEKSRNAIASSGMMVNTGGVGGAGSSFDGLMTVFDYLMRPGNFSLTLVAKTLVDLNIINGVTANRIRNANSPGEAFMKGWTDENTVSGGDISEGLFGTPTAGLAFDILLDPITYIGVGAIAAGGKASVRAAQIARRIERANVGFDAPRLAELTRRAAERSTWNDLETQLTKIADDGGVDLADLGKTDEDKMIAAIVQNKPGAVRKWKARFGNQQAKQELLDIKMNTFDAELADQLRIMQEAIDEREAAKRAGDVIDNASAARPTESFAPSSAAVKNVEQAAAWANRNQRVPGFELRVGTGIRAPSRSLLRVRLPESTPTFLYGFDIAKYARVSPAEKQSDSPLTKGERLFDLRSAKAKEEVRVKYAEQHTDALDALSDTLKRHSADSPEVKAAEKAVADIEAAMRVEARNAAAAVTERPRSATLGELTELKNRQRVAHSIQLAASNLDRQLTAQWTQFVEDAIRPLNNNAESLGRVVIRMNAESATGGGKAVEALRLNETEEQVMKNLQIVARGLERNGRSLGTLTRFLSDGNYIPRQYQKSLSIFGGLGPADETLQSTRNLPGSGGQQAGRSEYEMFSMLSPENTAKVLSQLWDIDEVAALRIADQLFEAGRIRAATDLTARQVQRGYLLTEEQMADIQFQLLKWDETNGMDGRLFSPLANTEGILQLSRDADPVFGVTPRLFDDMPTEQGDLMRLAQAEADLARAEELAFGLSGAGTDDAAKLQASFETMAQQLRDEIDGLQVAREAARTENYQIERVAQAGRRTRKDRQSKAKRTRRSVRHSSDTNRFRVTSPDLEVKYFKSKQEAERWIQSQARRAQVQRDANFPFKPTDEYAQSVFDPRTKDEWADNFPVLNPRDAYRWRVQSEARTTGDVARVRAIDKIAGRSMEDTVDQFTTKTGDVSGRASDLVPVYDPNDLSTLIGYKLRDTEEMLPVGDVVFHERTLIPLARETGTGNPVIWYDPNTGREYKRASELANIIGQRGANTAANADRITNAIGADRLLPTDVMRDMRAEILRIGDWDSFYRSGAWGIWQKFMSNFRAGVTSYFPAFHVRNQISDLLMSMQTDTGVLMHPIANAKLFALALGRDSRMSKWFGAPLSKLPFSGTINVPGIGRMKNEDFLLMMDVFGGRSNLQVADLMLDATRYMEGAPIAASWRTPVRKIAQIANPKAQGGFFGLGRTGKIGRGAQSFSSAREDTVRFMTFMQAMRRNNGDVADSLMVMVQTHFDYGDLTLRERTVIRNLFLFYTWYRKNIPRQLMQIALRPGFFNAIGYTYGAIAEGSSPINQDWSKIAPWLPDMSGQVKLDGLLPEYLTRYAPIVTNWNGHTAAIGFGAPWADLTLIDGIFSGRSIEDLVRPVFALGNPVITTVTQAVTRQDMLTGRKLDKFEPSGTASIIQGIAQAAGLGDVLLEDREGRPMLPWALNVAMNLAPIAGRGTSYFNQRVPSEQDQGRFRSTVGGPAGRLLTGLNIYVTPENAEFGQNERLDLAYIEMLMARGYERLNLSQELPRVKNDDDNKWRDKQFAKFDRETRKWLIDNKVPKSYWSIIPELGPEFYKSKADSPVKYDLSLGSSGMGAIDWSGNGSTKDEEEAYQSPSEKALDRAQGRDKKDKPKVDLSFELGGLDLNLPSGRSLDVAVTPEVSARAQAIVDNIYGRTATVSAPTNKPPTRTAPDKTDEKILNTKPKTSEARRKQIVKRIRQLRKQIRQKGGVTIRHESLSPEMTRFAEELVRQTGLDPLMVGAWVRAEQGWSYSKYVQRGYNNWLNIGPHWEAPELYGTPEQAAKYTADGLKGKNDLFVNSPSILGIMGTVDQSAQQQAAYIGSSQWGTGDFLDKFEGIQVSKKPNKNTKPLERELDKLEKKADELGLYIGGPRKYKKPTLWRPPNKPKGKPRMDWVNGTSPDQLNPDIVRLGYMISKWVGGEPLQITSAYRGTDYDSNHSEGGALDIGALAQSAGGTPESELRGDAIAYAAVLAAGGTKEQAASLASGQVGYLEVESPNGHTLEFLWKGDGDHQDHVHVAVENPGRGEKVFDTTGGVIREGVLSGLQSFGSGGGYSGSGGGGGTAGGGLFEYLDSQGVLQTSSIPLSDSLFGNLQLDEQADAADDEPYLDVSGNAGRRVSSDDFDLTVPGDLLPEELKRRLRQLVK